MTADMGKDQKRRVAVVGAGVAGLCTLRHFSVDPQYEVTAFEQQNRIGGIWNYPDGCEEEPDAPDTSPQYCRVYRNLRTNSPRALTHMRDFPIADSPETYLQRSVVLDYLSQYADHFKLFSHIKFQHQILSITPTQTKEGGTIWKIVVSDIKHSTITEVEYDIVFICNGHFNKPYLPEIHEIEKYRGPVIHSSAYRTSEPYQDKIVLIIGAGSSGNDIVCELMHAVKKVIVKHRLPVRKFPDKFSTVQEVPHVTFTEQGVILPDGTPVTVDVVILCTGYEFHFPFLKEDCLLDISRGRVAPLYKHMIHCLYPTMIFIGLLSGTPFLGAGTEDQLLFCKAYLDGRILLPSKEDMLADCEEDYASRLAEGMPPHRAHMMRKKLWPYCQELAAVAGFPSHDPVIERISAASNLNIVWTPYDFRNYRIEKVDSETFICERHSLD